MRNQLLGFLCSLGCRGQCLRQQRGATIPTLKPYLRVSRPWMTVLPIVRLVSTVNSTPSNVPNLPRAIVPPGIVSVRQDLAVSTVRNRCVVLWPIPTGLCAKANTVIAMMDGMASTAMSVKQTMHAMR